MANRFYLPFLILLAFFLVQNATAQNLVNKGLSEHAIVFGGFEKSGSVLNLNYEIPIAGMVTLILMDSDGRRVWHKQAPLEPGPNRFSMNQAAFHENESYSFVLQYKLSEVTGQVPVP